MATEVFRFQCIIQNKLPLPGLSKNEIGHNKIYVDLKRTLDPNLKLDHYPLPHLEEIFTTFYW
jgi:hypothetical protein